MRVNSDWIIPIDALHQVEPINPKFTHIDELQDTQDDEQINVTVSNEQL